MWEGLWCQRSWWHCAMSLRVVEQSGFKYELISFYNRTDHVPFDTLWAPLGTKSPVHRTGKKTRLRPDWTGKNQTFSCSLTIPWKRKPKKTSEIEPVWMVLARFELDLCSPCKYALFTIILKKNGQELHVVQPKWYVTVKSNLHNNL